MNVPRFFERTLTSGYCSKCHNTGYRQEGVVGIHFEMHRGHLQFLVEVTCPRCAFPWKYVYSGDTLNWSDVDQWVRALPERKQALAAARRRKKQANRPRPPITTRDVDEVRGLMDASQSFEEFLGKLGETRDDEGSDRKS